MEKTLQVYLPYSKSTITQRFGDNATSLYAAQGLKGHPAYDWGVPWATQIPNCVNNAYCYSIMHQNDPVLMDYRAAFFIVETEDGNVYEISYGHMSTILALPGQSYNVGDVIGLVGNTGPVYVGQHEVTAAEKDAGSHAGAHLHGPQIRIVAKTKYTNTYSNYLMNENGQPYIDADKNFYGITNYDNGYNGCVSMAPYSTETLATDYKAPEAPVPPVVAQIVDDTAQVLEQIKTLPQSQQESFLERIKDILLSILPFLKG